MNKETIYIVPSDDITDILTKLKASEKKIVALVPPKKPTVLLSSVNIKLIARTAKAEKKAVVVISTDDSLTKLAMAANLPVAPSLKSRPVMPEDAAKEEAKPEPEKAEEKDEEEEKDAGEEEEEKEDTEEDEDVEEEKEDEDDDEEDEDAEEDDAEDDAEEEKPKKAKKEKPAKKEKKEKEEKEEIEYSNAFTAFVGTHKLLVIGGAVALVGIAVFLFWAFTIAPRVDVAVSVRTTSANFSENVSFTTKAENEKVDNGTFFLHEEKLEKDQTVKFTATGKKDMGDPASGAVIAYYQSKENFTFSFAAGSKFVYKGFEYTATEGAVLAWDGENDMGCENGSSISKGCLKSVKIPVKAVAAGEDYNISGQQSGWSSNDFPAVSVYNAEDIAGGTSRIVTVVQQSDVDLALDKMKSEAIGDAKNELYGKLSDTVMPIDASYKVSASDPQSTPGVGEEVKDGVTPQISTKTTYTVYSVDRVRIEEFIKAKASIEEGRRLYSIGEPFVEYFAEGSDSTYSAKLKTTYKAGPEISETEILDKIRGEKIGRIEPILKDAFSGISSVKTTKSYFWVNSIPSDENKVKIELTVEE